MNVILPMREILSEYEKELRYLPREGEGVSLKLMVQDIVELEKELDFTESNRIGSYIDEYEGKVPANEPQHTFALAYEIENVAESLEVDIDEYCLSVLGVPLNRLKPLRAKWLNNDSLLLMEGGYEQR